MLKQLDYYKSNYKEVFNRFEKFYNAAAGGENGNFIFRALLDSDLTIYENMKLDKYNFERNLTDYIEDLTYEIDQVYEKRRDIYDDTLPNVALILGIGDYSAFVDGEIIFNEDTSWSTPVLDNLDDWKELPEIGSAKWYKQFIKLSEMLLRKAVRGGIPYLRGFFSPMDLAHALRGNDLYTDFYENPDKLHKLMDFCADSTIRFVEDINKIVFDYLGDSEYGAWFMEGYVNMSEDIACMVSPELYREFGAPYTQKVIDYFGEGLLHCHSCGLHMVEEISRLNNVRNIWIATDPNQPKPINKLDELIAKSGGVGLSIDCSYFKEIKDNIDIAKEGNIAFCLPVDSHDEAKRITDYIRKHSRI